MEREYSVLLVCGVGASSAFMAMNLRKAIQAHHINMKVNARSESDIENYARDVDLIMVAPHLAMLMPDLQEQYKDVVRIEALKPEYFKKLDGEACLAHIMTLLEEE
ncbi:MAG: PTS sugar transporter subunit IIB [Bulleidia sp.]|nr:PTS sugar transporter subunit IIB [Bulleidia sp.]